MAFRAGGSDAIVESAAKANIEELQSAVSGLAKFREEASAGLRQTSADIERDLVARSGEIASQNSTFAEQLGRIKQRIETASSPGDKVAAQQGLLAAARTQGLVSANIVLCRCVNTRTGVTVYSFFVPQNMCISGSSC
jgi:hypothetical protein